MVEPLSIAAHAVGRTAVDSETTAVVVGSGMIGLLIIQTLQAAGCGRVIAMDIDPRKLDLAKSMGAEAIESSNADIAAAAIREMTGGGGADVAYEVVGRSATVNMAIDSVRKGGDVVLVGNLDSTIAFPLQAVVTRQLKLHGTAASSGEYGWCLDMISTHRIDVEPLVSAVAPLSEGPTWFDRLRRGDSGLMKVVLTP
jgi:L-iditol 2-dehydrogenase